MVWGCDVERGNGSRKNDYENDVKERRGKRKIEKIDSWTRLRMIWKLLM